MAWKIATVVVYCQFASLPTAKKNLLVCSFKVFAECFCPSRSEKKEEKKRQNIDSTQISIFVSGGLSCREAKLAKIVQL